jgi:hypothetical protein
MLGLRTRFSGQAAHVMQSLMASELYILAELRGEGFFYTDLSEVYDVRATQHRRVQRLYDWWDHWVTLQATARAIDFDLCDEEIPAGAKGVTLKDGDHWKIRIRPEEALKPDREFVGEVLHELIHVGIWGNREENLMASVLSYGRVPVAGIKFTAEYIDVFSEVAAYTAETLFGGLNRRSLIPQLGIQ